jgi:hypothetical protein
MATLIWLCSACYVRRIRPTNPRLPSYPDTCRRRIQVVTRAGQVSNHADVAANEPPSARAAKQHTVRQTCRCRVSTKQQLPTCSLPVDHPSRPNCAVRARADACRATLASARRYFRASFFYLIRSLVQMVNKKKSWPVHGDRSTDGTLSAADGAATIDHSTWQFIGPRLYLPYEPRVNKFGEFYRNSLKFDEFSLHWISKSVILLFTNLKYLKK